MLYDRHGRGINMHAAHKLLKNSGLLSLIALASILPVPGPAQTAPAFSLDRTTVSLNQQATFGSVAVTSTGAAITFTPTISYAADGGNNAWLQLAPGGSRTTPASVDVQIGNVAGLVQGTYTAT